MDLTGLGSVADLINSAVSRIWPDKTKALEIKAQVDAAVLAGSLKELEDQFDNAKAQLAVDATEAASGNMFVAGWRPFIGWVCGAAFAYAFVLQPFLVFALTAFHATLDPKQLPVLDFATISPVLLGMLGLGAMRSAEKIKGVSGGH